MTCTATASSRPRRSPRRTRTSPGGSATPSLKAVKYTIEHPDEAAQILKKAQPAADITAAVGEITLMTPYVSSGGAIGAMDQERVARAIATLQAGGLIPAGLTPDAVVDFGITPKA